MEFVRRSWAQVAETYRRMTPSSRLTLALLCALIVISLGYLFVVAGSGESSYLLAGQVFQPEEMATAQAALKSANLSTYQVDGMRIRIPRGEEADYAAALASCNALPSDFSTAFDQLIEKGYLSDFRSDADKERLWNLARQKELARWIRHMPGIKSAGVNIDMGQRRSMFDRRSTVTASVSIRTRRGTEVTPAMVASIRGLLSGAVSKMAPKNVTVVDVTTGRAFDDPSQGGWASHVLAETRKWTDQFKRQIREGLAHIDGLQVSVSAIVDTTKKTTEERDVDPKRVAVLQEETKTDESTSTTANRSGAPGVKPNTATSIEGTGTETGETSTSTEYVKKVNEPSRTVTRTERLPGQPEFDKVRASVGVPYAHYEREFRRLNESKDPTRDELSAAIAAANKEMEGIVLGCLPEGSHVVMYAYPRPVADGPLDGPVAGGIGTIGEVAEHYGSTVGLTVLALLSLLMMRGLVRKSSPTPAGADRDRDVEEPTALAAEADEALVGFELDADRARMAQLRDQVDRLAKTKPELASSLLRRWITKEG